MSKVVCGTESIREKIHDVTLYYPESKSCRMYPWSYECPVCGCRNGLVEGVRKCDVCRLKVTWVEVLEIPYSDRDLISENFKTLDNLKRDLIPLNLSRAIRRIVL